MNTSTLKKALGWIIVTGYPMLFIGGIVAVCGWEAVCWWEAVLVIAGAVGITCMLLVGFMLIDGAL